MSIAGRKTSQVPKVVRGSVLVHRRRCGKATCRCADGVALHESTVLSYSDRGRTRFVMLPAAEVAAVSAAVERYRMAKSSLEAEANTGLAELVARLGGARRPSAR